MRSILILHHHPVLTRAVALAGLERATRPASDWAALRMAFRESGPGAVALVDPYAGSATGEPARELEALLTDYNYLPIIAAMPTRGRHRDVVQLTRWGITEVISLDEENVAQALRQHLLRAEGWALRTTVRRLLPEGFPGRATALVLRAADVASAGGNADDISRSLRVSRRTVSRWFRRSRLPAPRRLLAWLRLLRAARILDDTERTVATVARTCGYASDSNLRTALARFVGRSPRKLRREGALASVGVRFRQEITPRGAARGTSPPPASPPSRVP